MQAPEMTQPQPKRSRGVKLLLWIIVLLLGAILALILIAARAGLVPGVSTLVGASAPRDLGVKATPADFSGALQHLGGYKLNNQPTATDPKAFQRVYSGQVKVDQELSQSEISAIFTYNHVTWYPLRDAQIKIHADGVVEGSARLQTKYLPLDQLPSGILKQLPSALPAEVPIYLKGTVKVVGPKELKVSLQAAEVGKMGVPATLLSAENQQTFNDMLNERIRTMSGLTFQELSFQDGKVRFKGTMPQEFKRVPVKP